MRRSFKRAFSLVLALLMLTLAIPSGLTVTAADATSSATTSGLEKYTDAITEKNATYVYVIDGTTADGHYKTLEDAIMTARSNYDRDKTGTHYMKVLTSLTPAAKDSAGTNINFTINFSLTVDGSAAATKPLITVGNTAVASYWLCAGNGTTPVVTFKGIDFDFSALKKTDNGTAQPFAMRGGKLVFDNCVIREPSGTTVFQNGTAQLGALICVDTKIVSNLSTLAPATKDCVNFSASTVAKPVDIYLENCNFVTSSSYPVYAGKGSEVEIYGGTYKTTHANGYALCVSDESTATINGGAFESANNALWTGAKCAVTINDGAFKNTNTNAAAMVFGANSSVVINDGSVVSPKTALNIGTNGLANIYGGYFETTGENSITIDACDNNSKTAKPSDVTTNVYAPAGACTVSFYGGYFVNSADDSDNAQVFVIRPRNGAVNNIYGGTFVSTCDAAVIGAGESKTTGYLNIYGGEFIKSGTTGENLMKNYFNADAENWGAKYFYLYGGTYYTAKANDNTAYRLSTHADTTYNRAFAEVNYSEKPAAPQTATLAGRDGKVGTRDDITAAWVDICTISCDAAGVDKQLGDTKNGHKLDALADAITENNADFVYVVDGVGTAQGAYATLADAMTAARNVYNGGNRTATHYIKLMVAEVTEKAAFDTVNFDLTIDGTKAAQTPVITVGSGDSTASAWMLIGNNTAPVVTIKGVKIDFTAVTKADGAKADGFGVRGGTLVLDGCVVVEPAASDKRVFQDGPSFDQTIVCLDTKIASSLAENAVSTKTIINYSSGAGEKKVYLDGCDFTSTATPIINLGANCNAELYVYGGTYKTTGGQVIKADKNTQTYIYGGEFEAASITIANTQADPDGAKPEGTPKNAHVAEGASHVYIYGGSFKVTGGSGSFVFRPWRGAAASIYGGTFEAPNGGAVFGAGESGSRGYVYVYGGTFIKSATTGDHLLTNNYNTSNNWKDKYYYIYGGTFYTAKADDIKAYRAGSDVNDRYNRAYGEVVYTNVDKSFGGKTYVDAVTVSMKAPAGTSYAQDLFANAYQQITRNATARSEKADLRLVVEIKNSELERFSNLGFWVSGDNATAIDIDSLDASVDGVTDRGDIRSVYVSINEVKGTQGQTTFAREGYSFVVLEIKDIDNSAFNSNVYFRIYAKEVNEATGETTIHYSDVKTAGVYKSLG